MKTHLPSAVILCASLVLFCVHSFATENQTSLTASPIATSQTSGGSTSSSQGGFVLIPSLLLPWILKTHPSLPRNQP